MFFCIKKLKSIKKVISYSVVYGFMVYKFIPFLRNKSCKIIYLQARIHFHGIELTINQHVVVLVITEMQGTLYKNYVMFYMCMHCSGNSSSTYPISMHIIDYIINQTLFSHRCIFVAEYNSFSKWSKAFFLDILRNIEAFFSLR